MENSMCPVYNLQGGGDLRLDTITHISPVQNGKSGLAPGMSWTQDFVVTGSGYHIRVMMPTQLDAQKARAALCEVGKPYHSQSSAK